MKAFATIRQNVMDAFVRFPVAFLASACFFFLTVIEAKAGGVPLYATLACTCFWAISATLFTESRNGSKIFAILAGLGGGSALFLLFSTLPNIEWSGFLVMLACVASMKVAPYLHKGSDAEHMGFFCCSIFRTISFTFWVALVLFLGGVVILGSLHYLFGMPIHSDVYVKFWLFCTTFFAPVFAMGELPRDFNRKIDTYTRPQRIVIVNLLLPLMLVYSVILWLYIAKIVVLMELPKGNVAYMVSAFSLGGLLLYFFSSLQASSHYTLMRFWQRYFPLILSAPLILLIIGITIRIRAYGVTEDRYAVALLAAWLTGAVIWIAINRNNAQKLIWIYASGVSLVFLAAFGPWSAASISQWSQVSRLEGILKENNLLNDEGHIIKQGRDVPKSAVMEISSIVNYLTSTKKITAIRPWFSDEPNAQINKKTTYFSAQEIMQDMGLQYLSRYHSNDSEDKKIRFNHSFDPIALSSAPFDISGYDYMLRMHLRAGTSKPVRMESGQDIEIELDNTKMRILLTPKRGKGVELSLDEVITALKENNPQAKQIADIPVSVETPSLRAKLYITHISGYFDEENIVHIQNMNIILLYQHR